MESVRGFDGKILVRVSSELLRNRKESINRSVALLLMYAVSDRKDSEVRGMQDSDHDGNFEMACLSMWCMS